MSGKWCYLCKLSYNQMQNVNATADNWTMEEMRVHASLGLKGTEALGMKNKPWWPFLSLTNYIPPLLHALIGIGNDILRNFRNELV
jgi:hypothetical protein